MFLGLKAKHLIEYGALKSLGSILGLLPYRAALALAYPLAWVSFHVFRFRVKEAKRRINFVMGENVSERRAARWAWLAWRNLVFSAVEMLRIPSTDNRTIASICSVSFGADALKRHCASGQGAIIALPHMGSWEMGALLCRLHGLPIFTLAAGQKNPMVDRYMNELRSSPGIGTVARGSGAIRRIVAKLKEGKVLAILPDVRVRTGGIEIPFLKGVANLGEGMARFAIKAGVPVFPVVMRRVGWTRHEVAVGDPIWADKELDKQENVRKITTEVMGVVEAAILRNPDQWFWFNKRWILDPVEQDHEGRKSTSR